MYFYTHTKVHLRKNLNLTELKKLQLQQFDFAMIRFS